jgi:surface protein
MVTRWVIAALVTILLVTVASCVRQGVDVFIFQVEGPLWVGELLQFGAVVVGAEGTGVTWSSSDPAVASISVDGMVTGVAEGQADITATSVADPSSSDSLTVTVVQLPEGEPMRIQVDTRLIMGTTVTLPLRERTVVIVDWGDGRSSTAGTGGDLHHTYVQEGSYTIEMAGYLTQFGDPGFTGREPLGYPNAGALTAVLAWGELGLVSLSGAFTNAVHLVSVPEDLPTTVTDLSRTFAGASAFNQPIGGWDTANVTNMTGTFAGASAFDQPIGGWDIGNVTSIFAMFEDATAFNQPIGDWETGSVRSMARVFSGARAFNQPIGSWDTSNVTSMEFMFDNARSFDQPVGGWDTSGVTSMTGLFAGAIAFDQEIAAWDTSSVELMDFMFFRALAFDRPIGGWRTRNVIDMSGMFGGTDAFDQPIGGWDTSSVLYMDRMFWNALVFDQDLSGWCVAGIASEPDDFALGAGQWASPKPVWGTCP